MCVVLPALIIIRTWRESALTRCFHEGGGREGGWRNLRLCVFSLLLLDCHNILFFLSFPLSLCVFFRRVVSFLPPSTQINIVLCHANRYISLPCSLDMGFLGKVLSRAVYLPFSMQSMSYGCVCMYVCMCMCVCVCVCE